MKRLALLVIASVAQALSSAAAPPSLLSFEHPTNQCAYRLRLASGSFVDGLTFSNDGSRLYLRIAAEAVNIWELLVYCWPELLGGSSFAIATLCLLLLWRIRSRPHIPGAPHCRACNYCLCGVQSGICPECGRRIRRPVIGRTAPRRSAFPAALLILVTVGYGGLWALRLPRTGAASDWFTLWSFELEPAAKARGLSLNRWLRGAVEILSIDLSSGQTRRVLSTGYRGPSWIGLTSVSGRDQFITTLDPGDRLALVSACSGRVLHELARPPNLPTQYSCWWQIAGFDHASRGAFVVLDDSGAGFTRLLCWDLETGKAEELLSAKSDLASSPYSPLPCPFRPHSFLHVAHSNPLRFLELGSSTPTAADLSPTRACVLELGAPNRIVAEFTEDLQRGLPVVAPDGQGAYIANSETNQLVYRRLADAQPCEAMPPVDWAIISITSNAECNRLIALAEPPRSAADDADSRTLGFLAGDLQSRTWLGHVTCPDTKLYQLISISPDGRRFAASAPHGDEVLVYDLTKLTPCVRNGSQSAAEQEPPGRDPAEEYGEH